MAPCIASTVLAPSKVGGFSTFPTSMNTSAYRVAAIQLELANETAHGGGTNSKHADYLCSEQEQI